MSDQARREAARPDTPSPRAEAIKRTFSPAGESGTRGVQLVAREGSEAKPEAAKPEPAKSEPAKPEAAKPEAAKPDEAKPEAAKPDEAKPEAAPAAPEKPVVEVLKADPLQEGRRQVAVYDDHNEPESVTARKGAPDPQTTHGKLSALAAERAGYGVTSLQHNGGPDDLGRGLTRIADMVEKDGLLRPRDVLNVSMGRTADPTFESLSQTTGLDLNRQNIGDMREKLFNRLGELKDNPEANQALGGAGSIQDMLQTNEAIQRLQGRGIDVVHAAGNEGSDRVSVGFLNARHQLSATDGKGNIERYSADHALTKPSQGTHETREVYNPLTPQRLETGRGFALDVGNGKVQLPLAGPSLTNQAFIERGPDAPNPTASNLSRAFDKEIFTPAPLGQKPTALTQGGQGGLLGLVPGTSFANWGYLPQNLPPQL